MQKDQLKKLIIKIFVKHNLSLIHAKICTEALINAELLALIHMVYQDLKCIVTEL